MIAYRRAIDLLKIFFAVKFISCTIRYNLPGNHFLHCEAWTHSLLFKSKETFKLAEIQNLEASLQTAYSECLPDDSHDEIALRFNLTRLVVDRATGSSLFRLDLQSKYDNKTSFANVRSDGDPGVSPRSENFLRSRILTLSSLRRCDWIGQVIVEGCDPHELVEKLQQQQDVLLSPNRYRFDTNGWNLNYIKFVGEVKSIKKPMYSMKSLLCAVAHEMPSRPSLTPALAKSLLLIVDTVAENMNSCFLIQCINNLSKIGSKSSLQQKWARRPFQYSSAINFEIAEMVLEILMTLCNDDSARGDSNHTKRVLLDPTCGSGTFLALALANDFYVEGCDINPSVADGAIQNIEYLFDKEKVNKYANVEARDSCNPWRHDEPSSLNTINDISCVVANLPWVRPSFCYEV